MFIINSLILLLSNKLVYYIFIIFILFITGCAMSAVKLKNCPNKINYITNTYDTFFFQNLKSAFVKQGIDLKLNDNSIPDSLKVSKSHQVIQAVKTGRLVSKFDFNFSGMTDNQKLSKLKLAYFHTFNVYHLERLKYVSFGLNKVKRNHELKATQDISLAYIKQCSL